MTKDELKIKLLELFPSFIPDESGEWLNLPVPVDSFLVSAELLRHNTILKFDFLFCLTCVDWKTHLTMVYHMTSTGHRQPLVVKVQLDRSQPAINTVSHIWRTAEFHEREVYEM